MAYTPHTWVAGETIDATKLNANEQGTAAALTALDNVSADKVLDGTTNKAYTAAEKTKLGGVAPGATVNSTDAQLRDRTTHTGTQPAATITGLSTVATSGAYGDLSGRPIPPVGIYNILDYGAKVDGVTDDTAAWAAAFAALGSAPGHVYCPGVSVCGPNTIILNTGQGLLGAGRSRSRIILAPASTSTRLVTSTGLATYAGGRSSISPYGLRVRDLTLDGNAANVTGPRPIAQVPGAPTFAAAAGTLAAGTYAYRVTAVAGQGETAVGRWAQITLGAAGGVAVSWPAVTGATAYRIYGRSFSQAGSPFLQLAQVTVTNWTDDGSATTSDHRAPRHDSTGGALMQFYAHSWDVDNIAIINSPGIGAMLEWGGGVPANGGPNMEASLRRLVVQGCYGSGLVYYGPHDSHASSIISAQNGQAGVSVLDNVVLAEGPLDVNLIHAWGQARYAIAFYGQGILQGMRAEGGLTGQVFLYNAEVEIDGKIYRPGATASGVVIGDDQYQPQIVRVDVKAEQFTGTTGPAFDIRYAGPGLRLKAMSDQTAGTVLVGTVPANSLVDVTNPAGLPSGTLHVHPAGGPTLLFDDFSAPALSSAWTSTTGGAAAAAVAINNSRARLTTGATGGYAVADRVFLMAAALSKADAELLFSLEWGDTGEAYAFGMLRGSTADIQAGATSYGLEAGNGYAQVNKYVAGVKTQLGSSISVPAAAVGLRVWFRFRVQGSLLLARSWVDGAAEPTTWAVNITDTSVAAPGLAGFNLGGGNAAVSAVRYLDNVHISAI